MMMLASMAASGAVFLDGGDEYWMRGSSITHLIAVFIFMFLWKLHRFLGRTLVDDFLDKSLSCSYPTSEPDVKRERVAIDLIHKPSNDLKIPEEDDLFLQREVPNATAAERLRFFTSTNGKRLAAVKALRVYEEWRSCLSPPEGETPPESTGHEDTDLWNIATAKGLRAHGVSSSLRLPRFARTYRTTSNTPLCDSCGSRIIHVIPGLMDERICSTTVYATVLACYMDLKLCRESTEKIAVVVDVRGGIGWRNLHAANQLPFIQHTCQLLLKMFPERLSRAVVFPIPSSFVWLWTMASQCIEKKTRDKIGLLSGTATIRSPPPFEQMMAYMSEETAMRLEQERAAMFVSS